MGARLRLWRQTLGATQAQMADRLGMHIGVLKKYETGQNIPGGEALAAIARTGVNMTWLLTGEGDMRWTPPAAVEIEGHEFDDIMQRDTALAITLKAAPQQAQSATLADANATDGTTTQPPGRPHGSRWATLMQLVETEPDPQRREAILTELLARARAATELAELRRAVQELRAALKAR